ncbi:helix-turn-helix domain-containing protein [Kribbella sp. WER1]
MTRRGRPTRGTRAREDQAREVVRLLAQARREVAMTRQMLSTVSGVSLHTIAKIEQAAVTDPGFTVVASLADALGLSLDELVSRARATRRPSGAKTAQPPESRT